MTSLEQEEGHSLQGDSSYETSRQMPKKEPSKLISFLIHLRDNRVFYFILSCLLLVLIAMLQIHSAYRSYEDNERLVKLWVQEKELKDMMSSKEKQMERQDLQQSKFIFNHVKNSTINTKNAHHNDQKGREPAKQQGKQDTENKKNATSKPNTNTANPTQEQNKAYVPASPYATRLSKGSSARARPVAGITRAQLNAVIRWRQEINEDIFNSTKLSEEQRNYYEQKYSVSKYDQLPFCIVIPTFNNAKNQRHIKNIKSVLMQNYTNYHIVFIDDASTDGTADQVESFLKQQTKVPPQRYLIIRNTQQMRAMPNLRTAAKEYCKPYQIFTIVDGDDELIGRMVLKLFNSVFQKDKVWFAYSNFLSVRGNVGYSRPFPANTIKNNAYRKYPFVTSHLRAFYTQLFLNIKEEDLKDDQGNYLRAANDVAICLPILQQSHEKVRYIQQLTYFYNSNTGQNNHQLRLRQQKGNDKMLRKKKPYAAIKSFYQTKT